jgi:hypothetical protein
MQTAEPSVEVAVRLMRTTYSLKLTPSQRGHMNFESLRDAPPGLKIAYAAADKIYRITKTKKNGCDGVSRYYKRSGKTNYAGQAKLDTEMYNKLSDAVSEYDAVINDAVNLAMDLARRVHVMQRVRSDVCVKNEGTIPKLE